MTQLIFSNLNSINSHIIKCDVLDVNVITNTHVAHIDTQIDSYLIYYKNNEVTKLEINGKIQDYGEYTNIILDHYKTLKNKEGKELSDSETITLNY